MPVLALGGGHNYGPVIVSILEEFATDVLGGGIAGCGHGFRKSNRTKGERHPRVPAVTTPIDLGRPNPDLFAGFTRLDLTTRRVRFAGVMGGTGTPVLLLHGYSQRMQLGTTSLRP